MKCLLVIFISILMGFQLKAQVYGNEWINFSQQYFRFPIIKTGLYRLDSTTLSNSGIPIGSINPKNIQLISKGQFLPLYILGESDNVLNGNDYIEFYAERNDGKFDSLAYNTSKRLPNPYVPLFNDTNYVYFTWSNATLGSRYSIESDVNFSGYTNTPYFYNEKIYKGNSFYSAGRKLTTEYLEDPRYIEAEGYGFNLSKGAVLQPSFGNIAVYQNSNLPVYINTHYSGNSENYTIANVDHELKLEYIDNNNNSITLHDTLFYGYNQIYVQKQINSSQLQNTSSIKLTSVSNSAFSSINNSTNVHYLAFKYPQIPDLLGQTEQVFYLDDNQNSTKSYLDIQNVNASSGNVILYDLTTRKRIATITSSNSVKALIPNSGFQKKCLLTNSNNITAVTGLMAVNQTGYFTDLTSGITDSAFVIISNRKLQQSAEIYKQYRQSFKGGNHQVILSYVEELYDQFAYGNQKNPLAIKNFCRFLSDNLPKAPKYVLLIGKSVKNDFAKNNPTYWKANDLPTMGIPSSDNLFTTNLHGTNSSTPFIPIGRISALNNQQVYWYLDKVKAYEDSLATPYPKGDWQKRVLHFAGGAEQSQQDEFEGYLNNYASSIEDTLFGGQTFLFKKTSTAPIQITVSDSVKQLIEYGAKIITFFGHGSAVGFDQAIDDPNDYNNEGKYPLFLANSCYSGDIHELGTYSTSENFTLIDKKGSIGFLASSSLGLVNTLHSFSGEFYRSISYETYMKGIGDGIKNACFQTTQFYSPLQEITCLEMTLQGDPSIKLNAYSKPDYQIKNSSIFFNTTQKIDSIGVNVVVKNLGRAINDSFIVRTARYLPNGDSVQYKSTMKAPLNCDTLRFFIDKDFTNGIGLNHFKIEIDAFNEIAELFENNNSTIGTVDLFISGGDVVPVFPYKYAIVPLTSTITLKASTADPLYQTANYRVQIDTSDVFSNPINSATITSSGGVVEWNVNLPYPDSTVYFWRITKDSTVITDHLNWRESSFQTIGNKHGWSQAHFHQFKNDGYQFVKYRKSLRKFVFENDVKSLTCNDGFLGYVTFDQINYEVNNVTQDYWTCSPGGGWSFAVFDSITALPYVTSSPSPSIAGQYNNCVCYARPLVSVSFGSNNYCNFPGYDWKQEMENFLASIPPNNKVLAWSIFNYQNQSYSNSLLQQFESFGSTKIRTIKDSLPYIIFGTKGAAIGTANEISGTLNSSVIKLQDTLKTRWNEGYVASEIIGPATKWKSLHWKQTPVELPNKDSVVLQVMGIQANGSQNLITTFNATTTDVLNLDTYVDAALYPTIQLIARMKDATNLTPPQIKKWQVIYDEVPECAINHKKGFKITSNDTLQEGDDLIVHLPIENIGALPFSDSIVINYWIEDNANIKHHLPQKLKASPFNSSQIITDTIKFKSSMYSGANYLWVDVNAPTNSRYQKEQYHFNNIIRIPFWVQADATNPLLDVTFDGTHILNGDVISAKPNILVTLKDENKFLALNDTGDFLVYIQYPNQSTEKRLFFNQSLLFTPAQLPNNSCKIEWKPEFAVDGKYQLRVQATDRSQNESGSVDYKIQFEVINKQTITEVMNYPNPFSTSTRFVFTLTGSEIPDIFIIQIMTITGKVVREINKNELGNLHIGRNLTDYAWDGKDDFGDKLGNGVYLYRVITSFNGQAVEKRETEADTYFKKGIGKMVIIR